MREAQVKVQTQLKDHKAINKKQLKLKQLSRLYKISQLSYAIFYSDFWSRSKIEGDLKTMYMQHPKNE